MQYQGVNLNADYYFNEKVGALTTDRRFYIYRNGGLLQLESQSLNPGTYTSIDGSGASSRDSFYIASTAKCIDSCAYITQGSVGYALLPNSVDGYPANLVSDFPVYSNQDDLIKYLTGKYYAPNGNPYDYKYTYYATWQHTSGTSGADMWMDYKLGASPVHSNNTAVYWDVKNRNYGIPDMNNGTNKYISNTYKNDYYVKTGTMDNQSMGMGQTPGVYPCKTFSSNIPVFSTLGELLTYITEKYVLTTVDSTNYTGYELNVVSNYPFFFITSTPSSRGEVYTAAKGSDSNIYLCRIYLTSNAHYWQVDCKYPSLPSGVTFSTNYYATVSDGVMTTSNRNLGGTPTNYPNLRVFANYQEAYDYITSL